MYIQKPILHVAHFSSWHSDSQLKRYSDKHELFWPSGRKLLFKKILFKLLN
jgi:hypothetical protein